MSSKDKYHQVCHLLGFFCHFVSGFGGIVLHCYNCSVGVDFSRPAKTRGGNFRESMRSEAGSTRLGVSEQPGIAGLAAGAYSDRRRLAAQRKPVKA